MWVVSLPLPHVSPFKNPLSLTSLLPPQPNHTATTINRNFGLVCLSTPSESAGKAATSDEYKPGLLDNLFLKLFRNKMVKEIGWESEKPGYDGLIEVANRLVIGRTNSEAKDSAVRILRSLFPPLLLELYRMLITPLAGGKLAALMVARVTALSCQWLMGPCSVNSVHLPDGRGSWTSGVFVERCKYLEESKCVGTCINTCKLPTQQFFKDYMGIPLLIDPNFNDYTCQFKFGIDPPKPEDDDALKQSCLDICPNATTRCLDIIRSTHLHAAFKCPKA